MNDYDENYEEEITEHRYIFLVRQHFGKAPGIDAFYELQVPAGVTGDQAQIMRKLKEDWCKEQIIADTQAMQSMDLRIRFNSDMFPSVCLVRTRVPITAEDMDAIIESMHNNGTLMEFLEEAKM